MEFLPLRLELGLVFAQLSEEGPNGLFRQIRGYTQESSHCPGSEWRAQRPDLLQVAQTIRRLPLEPPGRLLRV